MEIKIPIGYAVFSNLSYDLKIQRLLPIRKKQILYKKDKWKINDEKYKEKWSPIFIAMREALVLMLELGMFISDTDNNLEPSIMQSISDVSFTRLISINLERNNITSIEKMFLLKIHMIQEINLGENRIKEFRSFRKNTFNRLKYLDLHGNLLSIQHIGLLTNKELSKILLEWHDQKEVIEQNMSLFAKGSCLELKFVRVESKKRMNQTLVDDMLKKRSKNVQIWRTNSGEMLI